MGYQSPDCSFVLFCFVSSVDISTLLHLSLASVLCLGSLGCNSSDLFVEMYQYQTRYLRRWVGVWQLIESLGGLCYKIKYCAQTKYKTTKIAQVPRRK